MAALNHELASISQVGKCEPQVGQPEPQVSHFEPLFRQAESRGGLFGQQPWWGTKYCRRVRFFIHLLVCLSPFPSPTLILDGSHLDLAGRPTKLTERPSYLDGRHSDLVGRLSDLTERPTNQAKRPSELTQRPSDPLGRPSDLLVRPLDLAKSPSVPQACPQICL